MGSSEIWSATRSGELPGCRLGGDEVDQLFHPAEQGRIQVGKGLHPPQDVLPGAGDVALVAVWPTELLAGPGLPIEVARHLWPLADAQAFWTDGLPG